jgi:signal peptidase I
LEYFLSYVISIPFLFPLSQEDSFGTFGASSVFSILAYLLALVVAWFIIAQSVKRCHDVGVSGLWFIIPFYVVVLWFAKGEPKDNRYGKAPKADKSEKDKAELAREQWIKFIIVLLCYLLFLIWVKSWLGLIVVPFIFDAYITKKIHWTWWKDAEKPVRFVMSWVDAIVFALVAVYFVNQFFFQNYAIPSSSLEKSLLTGDYLFVSKVSYGPRIPQTPLTMPLTQHTLPVVGCRSYIEWPHWDYRRVKGFGKVKLNDIVVFNYPAGDTLVSSPNYAAADYYQMAYTFGEQLFVNHPSISSLNASQQYQLYRQFFSIGRQYIQNNESEYGSIISRPTDRRENYVKRCVGLPGMTLQIKNRIVYLDGNRTKNRTMCSILTR